jgi:predicted enzyme related to lactoylglutathione lyase
VKVRDIFFMLMVQDMERAVRFYRDVLGLDVENHTPEWSRLALGDKIIVLRGDGTGDLTWTGLHFEVQDIQEACLRVQEGGGRILGWPYRANGWTALADLADTEGNGFTFYSPPG